MYDMKRRLTDRSISTACILRAHEVDAETRDGILKGQYSVVLTSPEALTLPIWRKMLSSPVYKEKLCMFACDEAHCITEWGETFRPAYKEVAALKCLVNVPLLILSATVTKAMAKSLTDLFEVPAMETVAVLPDRPNIFLHFESKSPMNYEENLCWIRDDLTSKLKNCPKMIVYCRSISKATDIYEYLVEPLLDLGKKHLVQLYHSEIYSETEGEILAGFPVVSSEIRVLVSTIAFGMGVSIPDIRKVVHWGASKTILSYWQEVGRCGRDGEAADAYLYATPSSLDKRRTDESMITLCKELRETDTCIREQVLLHLTIDGMNTSKMQVLKNRLSCSEECMTCSCDLCLCCSQCKSRCSCSKSGPSFWHTCAAFGQDLLGFQPLF